MGFGHRSGAGIMKHLPWASDTAVAPPDERQDQQQHHYERQSGITGVK